MKCQEVTARSIPVFRMDTRVGGVRALTGHTIGVRVRDDAQPTLATRPHSYIGAPA